MKYPKKIVSKYVPGDKVLFTYDYKKAFKGDYGIVLKLEASRSGYYKIWNKRTKKIIDNVNQDILYCYCKKQNREEFLETNMEELIAESEMTFKEAIKKLNIEDYGKHIFKSNSHGELFHLLDYIMLAQLYPKADWFRKWFISIVNQAEKEWKHPESIFQHIPEILKNSRSLFIPHS